MNDTQRPLPISVLCALGILGNLVAFFGVLTPSLHAVPVWYRPLVIVFALGGFASFGGIWLMKRWGVLLYAAMFVTSQAWLLLTGYFKPTNLLLPVITLILGFAYFADMD